MARRAGSNVISAVRRDVGDLPISYPGPASLSARLTAASVPAAPLDALTTVSPTWAPPLSALRADRLVRVGLLPVPSPSAVAPAAALAAVSTLRPVAVLSEMAEARHRRRAGDRDPLRGDGAEIDDRGGGERRLADEAVGGGHDYGTPYMVRSPTIA